MFFDIINSQTDIVSVSVGKRYLYSIADSYVNEEEKDKIHKEIDYFINTIGSKEVINDFKLDYKLYNFFKKEDNIRALAYSLRGNEDEFKYGYLFYHMLKVYKWFLSDKKERNFHLWLKLEPKEPVSYFSLDDTLTNYNSILCKLKLKNYKKYTNKTGASAEAWNYQLCLLYLIVINKLYQLLESYIDEIEDFLVKCFTFINPIITGFRITLSYSLENIKAVDVIYSLMQLHSGGSYMTIKQNKYQHYVEFTYHSLGSEFSFSPNEQFEPRFETDTDGNRLIKLLVSGKKNTLNLAIDAIGLNAIEDLTDLAVNKVLFDLITLENYLDIIGYSVIRNVLSHTQEFKDLYKLYYETKTREYEEGYHRSIFKEDPKKTIKHISKDSAINNAFLNLKQNNLLTMAENFIKEFKLEKNKMTYLVLAYELSKKEDKEISAYINNLGTKQQAHIRKMVKYFKKNISILSNLNILNLIFKKVCYKW